VLARPLGRSGPGKVTTAWVLRGGASLGAAQVGMARALLEAGHHPDLLFGTSAGALNAAWLAVDPSLEGVSTLSALWTSVKGRDVFPISPLAIAAGLAGLKDHTVSPRPFARWLRSVTPLRRLEDGALPLAVATTDIQSGEEVLLSHGPAVPALLASSAMPGIFPPVRIGERWLMDGSIARDTLVGPAVEGGATRVWVLPSVPGVRLARPRTALDAVLSSSSIMLERQSAEAIAEYAARCELFIVPAPLVPGTSPFRLDRGQELINAGYEVAAAWLTTAGPVRPRTPHEPRGQEVPAK
jgi:NTE family protein